MGNQVRGGDGKPNEGFQVNVTGPARARPDPSNLGTSRALWAKPVDVSAPQRTLRGGVHGWAARPDISGECVDTPPLALTAAPQPLVSTQPRLTDLLRL